MLVVAFVSCQLNGKEMQRSDSVVANHLAQSWKSHFVKDLVLVVVLEFLLVLFLRFDELFALLLHRLTVTT